MWRAVPRAVALTRLARPISFYPTVAKAAKEQSVRSKKKKLDLGWDELTAPLEAVPLTLPRLRSLRVEHGRTGHGQTGARKFKALLPPLRWQNPDADISMRWHDEDDRFERSWAIVRVADVIMTDGWHVVHAPVPGTSPSLHPS